ncbi:hypothetical protein FS842_004626 [Serendipita sp. 407]|nr:hypothetical protein FRC15_002488 [Serendipita sp. 397]KAG8875119.1 hypothetical protein FRC20_004444 [Serendipita sp. 405]KAG9057707.1 hypothetical protein FS842_004626 [Serendipita sp. 407]
MSAVNRRPTLFVTGFPPEVRAKDLAYQFEKYGEIVRCDVPAPAPGRITRYAFIEYIDENDASKALSRLDGETYEGKKLIVEWAKRTPGTRWRQGGPPPPPPSRYSGRADPDSRSRSDRDRRDRDDRDGMHGARDSRSERERDSTRRAERDRSRSPQRVGDADRSYNDRGRGDKDRENDRSSRDGRRSRDYSHSDTRDGRMSPRERDSRRAKRHATTPPPRGSASRGTRDGDY